MEANAGLVKRLTTVGILAEVGKELQAEQNVFVTVGAGLDFAVVVVVLGHGVFGGAPHGGEGETTRAILAIHFGGGEVGVSVEEDDGKSR